MLRCLLLSICLFVMGSDGLAAGENEVKQGTYPFMALIYYSNDAILENGKRFMRNGILIHPQWLVSSTIRDNENSTFPEETLLARAGAVSIDANLTLNEDEFEQEREIIQVVHPSGVKQSEWWFYDISLLKTLVAFTVTPQVAIAELPYVRDYTDKTCYIVVYGNKYGTTDQRILMQLPVKIQTPEACGSYFKKDAMICSANYDNDQSSYDSNFCERNSGGPLICEDIVVGLQTYLNECKEPHLHLLLAAWQDYIKCGIEEQCQMNLCNGVCTTVDKDSSTTTLIETSISTIHPDRRSFTSETERHVESDSPQLYNEINETTPSLPMSDLKGTSEPIITIDDADTATTLTDTYTPTIPTTNEVASTVEIPSTSEIPSESETTSANEITSTNEITSASEITSISEITSSSEIALKSFTEVFTEVKTEFNVTGNNVTVADVKTKVMKSCASINKLKVVNILLAFFIFTTFV